jgi:hypothetical protein
MQIDGYTPQWCARGAFALQGWMSPASLCVVALSAVALCAAPQSAAAESDGIWAAETIHKMMREDAEDGGLRRHRGRLSAIEAMDDPLLDEEETRASRRLHRNGFGDPQAGRQGDKARRERRVASLSHEAARLPLAAPAAIPAAPASLPQLNPKSQHGPQTNGGAEVSAVPEVPAAPASAPEAVPQGSPKAAGAPQAGTVVASLGTAFVAPSPAKQPDLSGGHINWVASASCLALPLRGILAEVAALFGPVRVNSTCRSKSHNARVGGAPRSYHLTGNAVDFRVGGHFKAIHDFLSGKKVVGGLKHYGAGVFHIDTGPRRSWGSRRHHSRHHRA